MKASEVLQRYAEGRRDFRGENLRCLSFKGKDLSGADFSEADIRGTNFTKANLTGAKFVAAKTGLPKRWVITLLFGCFVLLVISSCLATIFGILVAYITSPKPEEAIWGWVSLFLFLAFNFLFIYRGISITSMAIASIFVFASTIAFSGIVGSIFFIATASKITSIIQSIITTVIGSVILIAVFIAMGSFIATAIPVAIASTITIGMASAITITIASAIPSAIAVTMISATDFYIVSASTLCSVFAFLSVLLYSYLGWRAIKGDPRDAWIRTIAIAFATTGGTNFHYANLTDTDFTKATLKNTDFRDATLTCTCFKQTKKLDSARPGKTYLNIPQVREVLITGQGQVQDFSRLNLQLINLQGANLADASFIGADLSNANLQDADLSRAKLVQTQLDKTDFTGATLTGAYIEDWGITRRTKFDGVRCEYIYMRLPTKYNPDPFRKPDNNKEVFADGEFGDFIKPIVDTLDLYHSQNVDPRAIAIAFKQLAEKHPEAELEIAAIEKRGAGNVLLRAATSARANRSALSSEYFDNYNEIKALNQELKAILAEKNDRIISLEGMVVTALQQPSFYAEHYHNQGDTMPDKSSNFKFGNVGGDVAGIAGGDISGVAGKEMTGVAGGDISGTVAVSIGELEKSDIPEAPKLADLLKQLTTAIESDTNLSDKDKAKALKQVKALAEAGQNPKDEDKKDLADTAITMLKGIVTGLPTAATFVESWNKLLPLITPLFGL